MGTSCDEIHGIIMGAITATATKDWLARRIPSNDVYNSGRGPLQIIPYYSRATRNQSTQLSGSMSYLLNNAGSEAIAQQKLKLKLASSEEQQQKVNEVRGLLGSLQEEMPGFLSDSTIRRFLGARNWSTEKAAKCLREAAKWRRQYRPEAIRWEDIADSEHQARKAHVADYLDKNGRSVLVTKTAMKSKVSAKEQIKHLVYLLEYLATNSAEEKDDSVVWLTDFRGWSISCTPLSMTRESLLILQNYYPGLIDVAIVFDPPRIFESFWKILKHFIEPKLNERLKFIYTNNPESQKVISDMFDLEKLDPLFGGRSNAAFDIDKYAEIMRRSDQMRLAASAHELAEMAKTNLP